MKPKWPQLNNRYQSRYLESVQQAGVRSSFRAILGSSKQQPVTLEGYFVASSIWRCWAGADWCCVAGAAVAAVREVTTAGGPGRGAGLHC